MLFMSSFTSTLLLQYTYSMYRISDLVSRRFFAIICTDKKKFDDFQLVMRE